MTPRHIEKGFSMLILERKLNGVIRIGNDITIMVTKLGNHKVSLGITAPQHLAISRVEPPQAKEGESDAT